MNPIISIGFDAKWRLPGPDAIDLVCPFVFEWCFPAGGELYRKVEEGYYVPVSGTPRLLDVPQGTEAREASEKMVRLGRALQDRLGAALWSGRPAQRFALPEYLKRACQDGFDCRFPASRDRRYLEAFVVGFAVRLDHVFRSDHSGAARACAIQPGLARKTPVFTPGFAQSTGDLQPLLPYFGPDREGSPGQLSTGGPVHPQASTPRPQQAV